MPLYIFGAASAVAGLLAALCLTESLGSPLPNTFKVVADFIMMAYYDCSSGPGEDEGQCQASLEVCLANEGGGGGVE